MGGRNSGNRRCAVLVALVLIGFMPAPMASAKELVLESGFVESGGERIYYETVGTGDAVVLSHGLGGNHAIWYQQVTVFAEHFQVITWDQRGFGRSTDTRKESGPPAAVEDLKALLDHLKIDRAHLVGQSMGGWAVTGFALKYPDRVRSLVLADTLGGIFTPEASRQYDAYIKEVATTPPPDQWAITRHPALGEELGAANPAQAFLYREIASVAAPAPAGMGLKLRQTAYKLEDVRKLNVPVLFVVGEHDPIFLPATIRSVAAEVKGAQVKELPGAGHSPYFETPGAWNVAVSAFLSETRGR
jgi:pimeloyl-ACP methyl ester carboxylesterase